MFRIRTVPDPDSSGSGTLSSASVEPPVEEDGEVGVVSTWTRRERRSQTYKRRHLGPFPEIFAKF
jgi:hypothetical protein